MKVPCLGCEDRHVTCHSECDKYKAYKDERIETQRLILEEHKYDSYFRASMRKAKKRGERRR